MKVLFICRGNIGRSVFASHLYNKITGTDNAFSAGTVVNNEQTLREMGEKVQNVIQVMNEENIDVSSHLRKQVSEELVQCADILIDMAETDTIPDFVKNHPNRIVWEVDNPKGTDLQTHKRIKEEIKRLIKNHFYTMKLKPEPFHKISSRKKDIELRLFDEKRQKIRIGNIIMFINTQTSESIYCSVVNLIQKQKFSDIFSGGIPKEKAGFSKEDNVDEMMNEYYSPKDISKYGVVGIVLNKL